MIAMELVKPGTIEPNAELTKAAVRRLPHGGRDRVVLRDIWQRLAVSLPPLAISDELLIEGLDVLALVPRGPLRIKELI